MQQLPKLFTIPTLITLSRLALVPFLVAAIDTRNWLAAAIFFLVGSVSDVLDGFLARRFNMESFVGACLDPIVDRVWMLSCYGALLASPLPAGKIPLWFFVVITVKEVLILLGALFFCFVQRILPVRPLFWGKAAGVVQGCYLFFMFAWSLVFSMPFAFHQIVLSIVALLTIMPLFHYAILAARRSMS